MRLENRMLKSFLRTPPKYPQNPRTKNISRTPKEHPKPENTPSEHLKNSDKNTSMLVMLMLLIMMLVMSMPLLMMMMMLTSMNHDQIRRADTRLRWLKPVAAKRSTGYSAEQHTSLILVYIYIYILIIIIGDGHLQLKVPSEAPKSPPSSLQPVDLNACMKNREQQKAGVGFGLVEV